MAEVPKVVQVDKHSRCAEDVKEVRGLDVHEDPEAEVEAHCHASLVMGAADVGGYERHRTSSLPLKEAVLEGAEVAAAHMIVLGVSAQAAALLRGALIEILRALQARRGR